MPHVGFRVNGDEHTAILKAAKLSPYRTLSDFIRKLVLENISLTELSDDWEIKAWNLFGINAEQLRYALTRSKSPEEFFSIVSRWPKFMKMRVSRTQEALVLSVSIEDSEITILESRDNTKVGVISKVVDQLDTRIQNLISQKIIKEDFSTLLEGATNDTENG
jgi:hypothetical protein